MEGAISQIKSKIDIVDFIGSYIPVKRTGRNYKALCPFHQEKTPSFVISPERQIWHCFGSCGDGGDIIKFLMKWENITFVEALRELAQKAGVTLKSFSYDDKEWQKKEKLLNINNIASEYYQYIFAQTAFGKKARDYLDSRSIHPSIVKKFEIGYAPSSWDSLLRYLKKKGYREDDMIASGLFIKGTSGNLYDRFRGRVIFPIKDARGNIIGFSGRLLQEDTKEAKYINTPETDVYHKRESLYGIHLAKEAIKKEANVLLVEGEFDMIGLYQHGIEYAVAIKGSAVTKEQLAILKRFTARVTLALDADSAGEEAVKRATHEAEQLEFEIFVVRVDQYKDPADAMQQDPASFKKQLKHPQSIYDFIIELASRKHDLSSAFGKKAIGEEVLPFISAIQNPIVQTHYVKKIADLLEVSPENIQELIKKKAKVTSFRPAASATPAMQMNREERLEKYLLSAIFQHEDTYAIADSVLTTLKPQDFSTPVYQKIVDEFFRYRSKHPQTSSTSAFCDSLPAHLQPACNELYLFSPPDLKFDEKTLDVTALEIRKNSLKKQISSLFAEKSDPAKEKTLSSFSTELKEVEKKISSLYNYHL